MNEISIDLPERFKEKYMYYVSQSPHILGFFGKYRWLSNFWTCKVFFEGLEYTSAECAYQAAKVVPEKRKEFQAISASGAKKLIKKYFNTEYILDSLEDWNKIKYEVMCSVVFDKFYRNLDLRQNLVQTKDRYLEEINFWHDNFFGDCICGKCGLGNNKLGEILMKVRQFWL